MWLIHMRLSGLPQRDQGRGTEPLGDRRGHDLQLAFALALGQGAQDRVPIPGAPGGRVQDSFTHFLGEQLPEAPPRGVAPGEHLGPRIAQARHGAALDQYGKQEFAHQVDGGQGV